MNKIILDNTTAVLIPYLIENENAKGAVIVCPGGGYHHLAEHEGEPVAKSYNKAGYHAYVLLYRVSDSSFEKEGDPILGFAPLFDITSAIAYVRSHSGKLGIYSDKIAICGFSAGGHLCATAGVHWNKPKLFGGDLPAEQYKPNALILCYPVISTEHVHIGCFKNLMGNETEKYEIMSVEKHIGEHTPPSFLWHTSEDASVPVQNTLVFATKLAEHKIPFETHVYPYGPHGIGLADGISKPYNDPHTATWMSLSTQWVDIAFGYGIN